MFALGEPNVGNSGGALDFAQKMLGTLGGGNRTSQNTTVANSNSISVNPTFVQSSGGTQSVAPSVGPTLANPSASGSSSAAGQDPSLSGLSGLGYRPTPYGNALYDPLNINGNQLPQNDMTLPLLAGGALLLFVLMQDS